MLRFVWDRDKAFANLRNHGIAFDEAATVFGDPLSITIADPKHSTGEESGSFSVKVPPAVSW